MADKESTTIATAYEILEQDTERDGSLYKWAQFVVKRHEAGQSIAQAGDWLEAFMAGINPDDSE